MYRFLRPLLFRLEAEEAHRLTLELIRISALIPGLREVLRSIFNPPSLPVQAFGLQFKNPVGLAAGFDKDGIGWPGLALLGFGHIELGTVTPLPQTGNPRPRLFRYADQQGLINRMGFPGRGAQFLENQIVKHERGDLILGVNIGKNAATPIEEAASDYQALIKRFSGLADYLVINVSSPNTIGLRRLQARRALDALLRPLVDLRKKEETKHNKRIPLLVKLSPDLSTSELNDAIDVVLQHGVDGVVATNTSTNSEILAMRESVEMGGISGKPLAHMSTDVVRKILDYTSGKLPIIGVGGIASAPDAKEKLDAGAALIQLYTGLVYQGPGLVKQIVNGLIP